MTVAYLGSLTLDGSTPDSDGDYFTFREAEGWDGPPVELSIVDGSGHGDYVARARYKARPIVVRGQMLASDYQSRWRVRDKLAHATDAVDATLLFKIAEPVANGGTKRLTCYLQDQPRVRPQGFWGFEFEIPLLAPDPRKYADSQTTTTLTITGTGTTVTSTVANTGNFQTPPILEIDGPATNPKVLNNTTGKFVQWNSTVSSGQTLILDIAARTATIGGTSYYGNIDLSASVWWELIAGNNSITFSRNSGAASQSVLRVKHRNAWR